MTARGARSTATGRITAPTLAAGGGSRATPVAGYPCLPCPTPPSAAPDLGRPATVEAELDRIAPVLDELGRAVRRRGHELALVGGPVRDAMLGRLQNDLDFTTSARPSRPRRLLKGWADAIWDMGRAFGTIGARKGDWQVEITTYRSEAYDPSSRKPEVDFGDTLAGDLGRRDFTVNAMAVRCPAATSRTRSAASSTWRTACCAPRAARGLLLRRPAADDARRPVRRPARVHRRPRGGRGDDRRWPTGSRSSPPSGSATSWSSWSARRTPRGLTLLVETGLAYVLPELPALALERDEHHRHKDVYEHTLTVLEQSIDLEDRLGGGPDFVSRFAALMHDVGKPRTRRFVDDGTVTFHHHDVVGAKLTRKRMQALRFSNDEIDAVAKLVELHLRFHGYGSGEWTDSAVRRYVRDAGDQLERLHILTRADCTTRNQRKADRLRRTYDDLEERIARLSEEEELASIRPDLDGNQIMEILGVPPGPWWQPSCSSSGWTRARRPRAGRARRAAGLVGRPCVSHAVTSVMSADSDRPVAP